MFKKIIFFLFIFIYTLQASEQTQKVSLQLLWKHQFEFAGFYMAKEKGFYKELGLEVELKEFDFGINITKDVEEGKSTFGIAYPSIILEQAKGANLILLNALFQSSPHVFVTLSSSNINTIQDFKNKTIMMEEDTVKTASLLAMMYANKVDNTIFSKVKPSFNIEDLINKKIDIFSSYLSNEIFKLEERGIKYNIFNPKDYGFDMYNDLIFTSSQLAKSSPELVYKFQKASLEGWEYAFNNMEETIELIRKKYNTQNKSKEALIYEANVLKRLAYYNKKPLGSIEAKEIQRIFDLYSLMGTTQSSIKDVNSLLFSFTPKELILTQSEKKYLEKKEKLTFCIDPNWMPYEKFDEKLGYVGIGADYIQLFEQKIKIPFELVLTKSWTESKQKAKQRVCDILPLSSNSVSRKKYMNVTTPHLQEPIVIATQIDTKFIVDFTELRGKKVGITAGYSIIKRFKEKYPYLEIVETKDILQGLQKVQDGELFGQIDAISTMNYYLSHHYNDTLKVGGKFNEFYSLGIASNKDEPLLNAILQKVVDTITQEEKESIYKKWDKKTQIVQSIDYVLLTQISIVILIIILLIVYRQIILRKSNDTLQIEVAKKTQELQLLNQELEEKIKVAINENTQKDAMLFQQSKMASMGEMIGNIAHQWRQPLTLISTVSTGVIYKYEAKMDVTEDEIKQTMEQLNDTAQFLSQTIDDFQDFLKPTTENEPFDISNVIHKNIEMFGKAFSNNNIEFVLDLDPVIINNNQNALLQVLINILNNAKDALKANQNDQRYIFVKLYTHNNNAIIEIKDNAGGIPDGIIDKIFEAYFTTKHQSQGTGLGLFMSYQIIVNNFHGSLVVSNEEFTYNNQTQTGAKLTITLPLDIQ